jgi:hypothetical protein
MAFNVENKKKVETGFGKPIWTTKDILKKKLLNKFSYNIEPTDRNPSPAMKDWNANHYKITVKNKETGARTTFYYSEGLGIKHPPETRDDDIFFGLVSSAFSDLPYSDYQVFEGLGYEENKDKIYNYIVKYNEKAEKIGLKSFLEDLSEEEKEEFS